MSQFDDMDRRRVFREWLVNSKAFDLYRRAMTSQSPVAGTVRIAIDSAFASQANVAQMVIDALWLSADALHSELERREMTANRPIVVTVDKAQFDAYLAGEVRRLTELVEQMRAKEGHA